MDLVIVDRWLVVLLWAIAAVFQFFLEARFPQKMPCSIRLGLPVLVYVLSKSKVSWFTFYLFRSKRSKLGQRLNAHTDFSLVTCDILIKCALWTARRRPREHVGMYDNLYNSPNNYATGDHINAWTAQHGNCTGDSGFDSGPSRIILDVLVTTSWKVEEGWVFFTIS